MATIAELFNQAVQFHQGGKLAHAEPLYRQVIQAEPAHAGALQMLGILAHQTGHGQDAVALIRQALALAPLAADIHFNLGNVYKELGQLAEAAACYRQVLRINPHEAGAQNNLGLTLIAQGQFAEATSCIRQALLGNSDNADLHNNLGIALAGQGQHAEACVCYQQALHLNSQLAEAHNNLGVALKAQGRVVAASVCYEQTLRLNPNHEGALNNLGNFFYSQGQITEAEDCYRRLLRANPNRSEIHNCLGNIMKDRGQLDDALACYGRARELEPQNPRRHGNLLYAMLFHPNYDARALFEEHRRWEEQQTKGIEPPPPFGNEPSPGRRLRIGYLSSFFRDQVVGRNIWPLLRHHDHRQFEITLYSHMPDEDGFTEKLRQCADHWHALAGWSDQQIADKIRQDGIDILVDLNLHMADNRLLVFARKPAPVQVTFAGYPGTTGLRAIDYRLTDTYLDPPGLFDPWYSETSFRLPHSFWCYDPVTDQPPVATLPALTKGYLTFGCLNNFCKINDGVLELWARVLRSLPTARLLLLAHEGSHRQRTQAFMARRGVAPERVEFCRLMPTPAYLALYNQLDIGLDTFPYNGHTTSLDSLWMGVPVVTLVGRTVVGRAGLSQLTNLDLPELIAATPDRFVQQAIKLAGDLPKLQELRAGLRARMKRSPLMDAAGFARAIEKAYRTMWREKGARNKE